MKKTLAMAGMALLAALATARAGPVDVACRVSGVAGSWLLDFTFTNNLGGTNNLYLTGVEMPTPDVAGSPVSWDPNAINGYNPSGHGGSNTNYDVIWFTSPGGSTTITPGHSVSGFRARSNAVAMPSTVRWMAIAADGTYLGPGCAFNCNAPHDNPGFEGIATPTLVAVGDAAQAGILLPPDNAADRLLLNFQQLRGGDFAFGGFGARFNQMSGADEAADMIGAKGRGGSLCHWVPPLNPP